MSPRQMFWTNRKPFLMTLYFPGRLRMRTWALYQSIRRAFLAEHLKRTLLVPTATRLSRGVCLKSTDEHFNKLRSKAVQCDEIEIVKFNRFYTVYAQENGLHLLNQGSVTNQHYAKTMPADNPPSILYVQMDFSVLMLMPAQTHAR